MKNAAFTVAVAICREDLSVSKIENLMKADGSSTCMRISSSFQQGFKSLFFNLIGLRSFVLILSDDKN